MATGVPGWLARSADGIWQTTDRLEAIKIPVLVVHSDSDSLFPLWMGDQLVKACGHAGEMHVVQGLDHNDPIFQASEQYWYVVAEWVKRQSRRKTEMA